MQALARLTLAFLLFAPVGEAWSQPAIPPPATNTTTGPSRSNALRQRFSRRTNDLAPRTNSAPVSPIPAVTSTPGAVTVDATNSVLANPVVATAVHTNGPATNVNVMAQPGSTVNQTVINNPAPTLPTPGVPTGQVAAPAFPQFPGPAIPAPGVPGASTARISTNTPSPV